MQVWDMSRNKRFNVTLPWGLGEALEVWARSEGNKPTTLASYLVEKAVREAIEQGKVPAPAIGDGDRPDLNELLSRLAAGEQIPDSELLIYAHQCGVEPETLIQLRNRVKGKNGNGHPIGA